MHIATPILAAALLAASATVSAAPAVETLPSGVKVEHLKAGEGDSPTANSQVMVHYRGTLLNGTEFDSSHKRGQPASFVLNQVIPCWTQGVQKMKVGGSAKLTCPPETAYGSRDLGKIPPNSTLNFEVQLLGIR
jgi:FKBP-type peptidyl-prolyl cis-trans isomerase FkpA